MVDMGGALADQAPANDLAQSSGPGAPVLLTVEVVVHGTLALKWTNPSSGCDMIDVQRKKGTAAYAVVQTIDGTLTEVEDVVGHSHGTFCYQLLCKQSGLSSAPSNEVCQTH